MKIYLVGGAVRDQLLHFPYHEKDWVVVGCTPEAMIAQGYTPVGKDFPVFLHPHTHEEYALARTERKTAPGYKGFTFHTDKEVSLEEDLLRRDLTINAMAMSNEGELIDPYGGQQDIDNRYLRHVSAAFSEDPVRVLRVARFMARYHHLGFRIADDTMTLMQQMVQQGETKALVAERVWQEMHKALHERHPEQFFETLKYCGALYDLLPQQPSIQEKIRTLPLQPLLNAINYHDDTARFNPEKNESLHAMIRFAAYCFMFSVDEIGLICQQLAVPNDFAWLAKRLKQHHAVCTDISCWDTLTLSQLFQQCDAIRKPIPFQYLLLACQAVGDHQETVERKTDKLLLDALQAYQAVNHQALIQQGYEKAELGEAIQQQRERQLSEWLDKQK